MSTFLLKRLTYNGLTKQLLLFYLRILSIIQLGLMKHWTTKHTANTQVSDHVCSMSQRHVIGALAISIDNAVGIFYILIAGFMLATVAILVELFIKRRKGFWYTCIKLIDSIIFLFIINVLLCWRIEEFP